jgi:predicted Zn-dependent protease
MQNYFNKLSDHVSGLLTGNEVYMMNLKGENSDFIRFNNAKIRQNGRVSQFSLELNLFVLESLRGKLKVVPEDPYLLYSTEVNSGNQIEKSQLIDSKQMVDEIVSSAQGKDLAGILATGDLFFGFSNSFGQRNWYERSNFNFDWSVYHTTDKAVKSGYAGFKWNSEEFKAKMASTLKQLEIMKRPAKTIEPGKYKTYLTPVALSDFIGMLSWGGFGLKSHRTKNTPLIQMAEGEKSFHTSVNMIENTKDGVSPNFQGSGYVKPDQVSLIKAGKLDNCLTSPRSAKEYDVNHNGADGGEAPESIELSAGTIKQDEILKKLDTGLYLNNTHYLNFSDRQACRTTGMTRFACFWVEDGEIKAPINVMRFDETIYKILGENLIGLTEDRDFLISPSTYESRETGSMLLPGALVKDFSFTL